MLALVFVRLPCSSTTRIVASYFASVVVCIAVPYVTQYAPIIPAFYINAAMLAIFGVLTSVLQGTIFGVVGLFPSEFAVALVVGQGLAGLFPNALRGLVLVALPPDSSKGRADDNSLYGAIVYYTLAAAVLLFCGFAYLAASRLPFTRFYLD